MDLERERRRLLERDAEWAVLSSQGRDVEGILSFWSDDARVFAPGLPPFSGKAALRSYVEGALAIPGFHITWTTSEASLSPDGRMGYLLSTNAVTMHGPGGTTSDESRPCGHGVAPRAGRGLALRSGHLER